MQLQSPDALIALDGGGGDVSFVSHAHSDHLNGVRNKERLLATPETMALGQLSGKRESMRGVALLDAGHILGSSQLFVEHDGESVVYTGDLRTRPSILFKGAEAKECDRLIIESTYGDPAYIFPDYYEVYSKLEKWVKSNSKCNILIGGYALGKSQELIKILNSFGVAPVVDNNIERFNSIYSDFGVKLDRVVVGTDEAEEAMGKPFVAIVEMKRAKRYFAKKLADAFERKTLVAVATGWAMNYRFDADASFVLSDHADFYDLLGYIRATNAKKIEFVHGDGTHLSNALGA
ncbi:MAG: MBL fold metallo-hydrolase [Candidatus Micrarchaeia archaeon]